MSFTIPTYENQVGSSAPRGISVPNIPNAPSAAFGTGIDEATGKLGDTVEKLGGELADHIAERQRQQQQAQIIQADTDFRKDLQNTMFSTDTVEKPDPSDPTKKIEVPSGVFNRQLGQAHGATQDFDAQYDTLKQKYLGQFTNPVQQNDMARLMDDSYAQHRQLVIHHEANQMRDNNKNILEGNLRQMVNDAGNITDPQQFIKQVQLGQDRQFAQMHEYGYDNGSIATATDKFAGDMAKSAVFPLVSPDPSKAQDYLNKIKPALNPDTYASLQKMIDVQSRQMAELAKFQKEQVYDGNMRDAMLDMFDGKLTLSEVERRFRNDTLKKSDYDILESKLVKPDYQILREMQVSDPSTFSDIRSAQLDGSKSQGELYRMIAQGNADGKITGDDAKYLTTMSKNVPPDPRDQQIAAEAQAVQDFGNRYFQQSVGDYLPVNVPGVSDIPVKKEQTAKDVQGLMSDFYKRVDKEGAQGERIGQIRNQVIQDYAKKRYPEIGRMTDIPQVVVGIDGKIQRLLAPAAPTKLRGQFRITRTGATDFNDEVGQPSVGQPSVGQPKAAKDAKQ